ncbi:MAG: membrane protein insertion efficiency factor YidD, partial [Proteobacteria bacterium]|nr:membrane protein insertion efficiency factor YidD [Pseudomonadota bacterium]
MIRQLPKRFLKGFVWVYQVTLSPFIGQHCRFEPTCSHYALQALEAHANLSILSSSVADNAKIIEKEFNSVTSIARVSRADFVSRL